MQEQCGDCRFYSYYLLNVSVIEDSYGFYNENPDYFYPCTGQIRSEVGYPRVSSSKRILSAYTKLRMSGKKLGPRGFEPLEICRD